MMNHVQDAQEPLKKMVLIIYPKKFVRDGGIFEMTSNTSKIELSEDMVIHSKEYMHKDLPDGTEVCLLKRPLTVDEWNQILKNQLIVEKLEKLLTKNFDWKSPKDTTKVCLKLMRILSIPIYDVTE